MRHLGRFRVDKSTCSNLKMLFTFLFLYCHYRFFLHPKLNRWWWWWLWWPKGLQALWPDVTVASSLRSIVARLMHYQMWFHSRFSMSWSPALYVRLCDRSMSNRDAKRTLTCDDQAVNIAVQIISVSNSLNAGSPQLAAAIFLKEI